MSTGDNRVDEPRVDEQYRAREQRLRDTIELRVPDRVPVVLGGAYFAARCRGLDFSSVYYDVPAWKEAFKQTIAEFAPDAHGGFFAESGAALGLLGALQTRWPGGPLPPNVGHQFVEGEYLAPEEYDWFLSDPGDFVLRGYLPRIYQELAPLAGMPPPRSWLALAGFIHGTRYFARPEIQRMFEILARAGREQEQWWSAAGTVTEELAGLGFPPIAHMAGVGGAPFDTISNLLRGMRGVMLDMYRRPEQLLAAIDKVRDWQLRSIPPADPAARGHPKIAFSALHRGSDGFMSKRQFETFYWPGLKAAILKTIEMGWVANPFFEGVWNERLEYLREIPAGGMICRFAETDMARAKEVLGDRFCLMGNVPVSLLQVGTADAVTAYCRELIRVAGRDGGFILRASSDSMDQARPENVRAMIDAVHRYGVY